MQAARRYTERSNIIADMVYTEWDTQIVGLPKKRERVNIVEKIAPEAKKARKSAVLTISLITIVFALFAGVVWRYAAISELGKENIALETQIEEKYSRLDSLTIDILEKADLRGVQEKAELLDMGFAESSQIRYIQLSEDNAHKTEVAATGSEAGFLEKLLKWEF